MPINAQQMRDILVSRKLCLEPVGNLWTVKGEKGERIVKNPLPSPELAAEEAEKILSLSSIRSEEEVAIRLFRFLSRGEYFIRVKLSDTEDPGTGKKSQLPVYEGIHTQSGAPLFTNSSFLQVAKDLERTFDSPQVKK